MDLDCTPDSTTSETASYDICHGHPNSKHLDHHHWAGMDLGNGGAREKVGMSVLNF